MSLKGFITSTYLHLPLSASLLILLLLSTIVWTIRASSTFKRWCHIFSLYHFWSVSLVNKVSQQSSNIVFWACSHWCLGLCRYHFILDFHYFCNICSWSLSVHLNIFYKRSTKDIFCFSRFFVALQTQFNVAICTLWSDNAKQYVLALFSSITTQQNGVVECKKLSPLSDNPHSSP